MCRYLQELFELKDDSSSNMVMTQNIGQKLQWCGLKPVKAQTSVQLSMCAMTQKLLFTNSSSSMMAAKQFCQEEWAEEWAEIPMPRRAALDRDSPKEAAKSL